MFTPAEHRGRGYGSSVTAAVVRALLGSGVTPMLYADAANPVSNRIYERMGFRTFETWTFYVPG